MLQAILGMLAMHEEDIGLKMCSLQLGQRLCGLEMCCTIAGMGFQTWTSMQALTSLSLQNGTCLTDGGVAALAKVDSLRSLNLKGCRAVTDEGLAHLAPLCRLDHLRLQVYLAWQSHLYSFCILSELL